MDSVKRAVNELPCVHGITADTPFKYQLCVTTTAYRVTAQSESGFFQHKTEMLYNKRYPHYCSTSSMLVARTFSSAPHKHCSSLSHVKGPWPFPPIHLTKILLFIPSASLHLCSFDAKSILCYYMSGEEGSQ